MGTAMGVTSCLLCVSVKVTPCLNRLIFASNEHNRGPLVKQSVKVGTH